MEKTSDDLRDDLIALLSAGRELAPTHDEALADAFLGRLEAQRRSRVRRINRRLCLYLVALAALVALPIAMILNTYVTNDGVLPRPNADALPALYWIALLAVLALLVGSTVLERTGRQVRVTITRRGKDGRCVNLP